MREMRGGGDWGWERGWEQWVGGEIRGGVDRRWEGIGVGETEDERD